MSGKSGSESDEGSGRSDVSEVSVGGHRQAIISVFATQPEARLNTRQIREAADVPAGSMSYHLDQLEIDKGLIEEVGREMDGQGSPAKVFALTGRGREFIDSASDTLVDAETSGTDVAEVETVAEDVDAIEERVGHLERENENRTREVRAITNLLVDEFGEERVGEAFENVGQQ